MGATNLGQFTSNANPATTVSGATLAGTSAGDKVFVSLYIPNSNPTFAANGVQFDGQNMTELVSARQTRSNKTICVFYYDDATGRASGKTLSATWTNAGTQNGGGAALSAVTLAGTNPLATGTPEIVVSNQGGVSTGGNVTSTTTGTPSDAAARYYALSVLGVVNTTAGQETPNNGYSALPQAINTVRGVDLNMATLELAPTVAAQSESWAVAWASLAWVQALILVKENTPGVPTNTTPPVLTGTPAVGSTLSSDNGAWAGVPTSYDYDWQRDVGSGGVTWVSIGTSQSVTTTNGNTSVVVASIASLFVGQPVFGANIPAGAVISEIPDSTHVVLSAAPTASATITARFGVDDVATYTVTADDLGCELRCRVTANNASGASVASPSNASAVVPAPSTPTFRIVVLPVAQSDNQQHSSTLRLPVLAGETLVYVGGCSVSNTGGDIGSIIDDAGDTWTQLEEIAPNDGTTHATQAFRATCAAGMAYGATVTTRVKQTTVVGANALNSAVVNVADTTGFDTAGTIQINGVNVTYSGITPTSLTGCGSHAAYTGGEAVKYHGQSPYWMVLAINPGQGATLSFDNGGTGSGFTTSPGVAAVPVAGSVAVAVGVQSGNAVQVRTPAAGWTKLMDGPFANAGAPYTGESTYSGAAYAQVLNPAPGTLALAVTTPSFDTVASVLVIFDVQSSGQAQQLVQAGPHVVGSH